MQTLISNTVSVSLKEIVSLAAKLQPLKIDKAVEDSVVAFTERRLEQLLIDENISAEAGKIPASYCCKDMGPWRYRESLFMMLLMHLFVLCLWER